MRNSSDDFRHAIVGAVITPSRMDRWLRRIDARSRRRLAVLAAVLLVAIGGACTAALYMTSGGPPDVRLALAGLAEHAPRSSAPTGSTSVSPGPTGATTAPSTATTAPAAGPAASPGQTAIASVPGPGGIPPVAPNPASSAPAAPTATRPPPTPAPRPVATGGVVMDGWGGIHPFDGAALWTTSSPSWQGWDIARSIRLWHGGAGGGWVLDGWGGIHPFGGAPNLPVGPYKSGTDWVRSFELTADAGGGWEMDGLGNITVWGDARPINIPHASWSWDIARDLVLHLIDGNTADGGWILDGWGAIHAFGNVPTLTTPKNLYLSGNDYMRGLAVLPDLHQFYLLDAYGNVHNENGARPLPDHPSWNWKIARSLVIEVGWH